MVATESGNRTGKIFSWSGKSQGILLQVRENLSLGKKSGKREILRVHIYSFPPTFIVLWHLKFFCTFYGHESCCINKNIVHEIEWQTGCWVFKKINPLLHILSRNYQYSCTKHMTWHGWKNKEMAVRRGLSPFPGLICDWSGKIYLCQGKSQGISETSGCGNHVGVKLMRTTFAKVKKKGRWCRWSFAQVSHLHEALPCMPTLFSHHLLKS